MEVNKLLMCRICLVENVRMYVFANTSLHEIYEKLTDIKLVTEDSRPILACFICYAKLKQCCRFKRKCLEAEELFAQMMSEDYEAKPLVNQKRLESSGYVITPTHHISVLDGFLTEKDIVKKESVADCDGQYEMETDSEHEYKSHTIYISPQNSTPGDTPPHHCGSDSEDDLPLMEFKTEEQEITRNKHRDGNTTSTAGAKKLKLEDTMTTRENNTYRSDSEIMENTQDFTSKPFAESKEPFSSTPADTNGINVTATENHNSKKVYNYCFNCKLSFSTSFDLIKHIRIHATDKKHKCKICQRSFDDEMILKTHLRSHNHQIISDICKRGSCDKSNLLKHSRRHRTEQRYDCYKCDICKRTYKLKNDLRKHIKKHTSKESYKCEICQCCFSKKNDLTKHFLVHNGGKPYKCEVCQRCYSQKSGLRRHMLLHTGEKPFSCDKCELSFNRSDHLKKHLWSHKTQKPYQCDYCGRFHLDRTSLKYHIQTHTGEKPYKCEICQRFFRNKISKSHMEKCSEDKSIKLPVATHSNVKSFKCDVCQRSYGTKGILKFHIKTHAVEKPYKCDICQRSFSYAHHLKDHILIHTGEKPYKCEICQSGFNKSSYLKVHMRAHTGEKPYQCDVCQRFFTRADNLKQHIRTHTGEAYVRRVRR